MRDETEFHVERGLTFELLTERIRKETKKLVMKFADGDRKWADGFMRRTHTEDVEKCHFSYQLVQHTSQLNDPESDILIDDIYEYEGIGDETIEIYLTRNTKNEYSEGALRGLSHKGGISVTSKRNHKPSIPAWEKRVWKRFKNYVERKEEKKYEDDDELKDKW
eukprot:UN29966